MGVVRLVHGDLLLVGHEHALVARGYGVFLWGVLSTTAGYPIYQNSSFGIRGYQVYDRCRYVKGHGT
jgi:hypothetical protein